MERLKAQPRRKPGRRRAIDPKRAVAYMRVSTEDQHLGEDAQRAAIESFAEATGIEVVAWKQERIPSGAPLEDRLALWDAIETAKTERAGLILIAKRDRLVRDPMLSELVRRNLSIDGIEIASADGANGDSPVDTLTRTILDAIAMYERSMIRARTRAALGVKRAKGERVSRHIPYGFRLGADGRTLEEAPEEQAAIARARELREAGLTLARIADRLETEGHAPRGARWHQTTVQRVLARS